MCPVCNTSFCREELLSGGGRLIAGNITDELHRLYEPSIRYGEVYPLIYNATVCPKCWFASMNEDFDTLPRANIDDVIDDEADRFKHVSLIFPGVDFDESRTLISGAAALYLAVRCYDFFNKETSPTIKQAISSLRASWLLEELDKQNPSENYDQLAVLFKKKSLFFYSEAFKREQSGEEPLTGVRSFGPDNDKNYAYEGALYINALLQYKYGQTDDIEERFTKLMGAKRTISKIFGIGKASKEKPGPLLEHARDLYDKINKELEERDQ
jgi:uncharacterized protein (DUF2225 family)